MLSLEEIKAMPNGIELVHDNDNETKFTKKDNGVYASHPSFSTLLDWSFVKLMLSHLSVKLPFDTTYLDKINKFVNVYNEFIRDEYGSESMSKEEIMKSPVNILYTDDGGKRFYNIQITYDVINQLLTIDWYDNETKKNGHYKEEYIIDNFFDGIDFDGYYSWAHKTIIDNTDCCEVQQNGK